MVQRKSPRRRTGPRPAEVLLNSLLKGLTRATGLGTTQAIELNISHLSPEEKVL